MYTFFIAQGLNLDLRTFGNVSVPIADIESQNELVILPGGGFAARFAIQAPLAPRQLAMSATINNEDAERLKSIAGLIGRLYRVGNQNSRAELKHVWIAPSEALHEGTELFTASLVFLLLEFWNGGLESYSGTFNSSNDFYQTIANGDYWAQTSKFECYCTSGVVTQAAFDNGHQYAMWQGQLPPGHRLIIDDATKSVTVNGVDSYSEFSRDFYGTKLRGEDWLPIPPYGAEIRINILGMNCSGTYNISYDKRYK